MKKDENVLGNSAYISDSNLFDSSNAKFLQLEIEPVCIEDGKLMNCLK